MSKQPGRRRVTTDVAACDDTDCTVLHVDLDAFFASVELLRRPELRGRPMMVAGAADRGVVLAATYQARAYGVRSAMPTRHALARCPGIVVVPPDHAAYRRASRHFMTLLGSITPMCEPVSIDEAFLDVRGIRRTVGRPGAIAERIRREVRDQLGLSATVGASATKFVAKLASSWAKPDGLLLIPPADVAAMLRPLPVSALWGVGPRTAEKLTACGYATVGEVANAGLGRLTRVMGSAAARQAYELAHGRDPRSVTPQRPGLSIGTERTFDEDLTDPVAVDAVLLDLAGRTGRRSRREAVRGTTVVVKVRFADFTTITRSVSSPCAVDDDRGLVAAARRCWDKVPDRDRPVRLIGVRLEGLESVTDASDQLSFQWGVHAERPGWDEAQEAVDRLADRFGSAAPRPATLLPRAVKRSPGGRRRV